MLIETMPIYVINLKKDSERLKILAKQFPEYYPQFSIVEATDGRNLEAKHYFEAIRPYYTKTKVLITPSELGCTLSHIKALEMFIASEKSFALILEDDVIGNDEDIKTALDIGANLPLSALVNLISQSIFSASRMLYAKKTKVHNLYQIAPFSYSYVFSNCAYLITRQAAMHILNRHHKQMGNADAWQALLGGQRNFYIANIFQHSDDFSSSNIEPERQHFVNSSLTEKFKSMQFYKRLLMYVLVTLVKPFLYLAGYAKIKEPE